MSLLAIRPADAAIPPRGRLVTLILAHGAGAGQQSPFMQTTGFGLAARGLNVVTFDFPYMTAGRRVPDPGPALEAAWREAIDEARGHPRLAGTPILIGGKSMGGRIASQVAAHRGAGPLAGLVFLGYPLHPPGKPHQRRDRHLPQVAEPMLFVQGTRDAFGTAEEVRQLLPFLPRATLHEVAAGDHSFKVPARAGKSQVAVMEEVLDAVAAWIHATV